MASVTPTSSSLRRYALTRLALMLPMAWILMTLVFLLMRVVPGDPISAALGGRLSEEELQIRRHAAGFDRPLVVQYLEYLGSVVRLDFGQTLVDDRPVTTVIADHGGATLELTLAAMLVAVVLGIGVGLLAGRFRDSPIDIIGRMFGIVIYAAPIFFLGFLAQIIFGIWLGWLPVAGRASPIVATEIQERTHLLLIDTLIAGNLDAFIDVARHLVLPAATLGLVIGGVFIRVVRVNVIQTLQGDYVEAARARGVRERAVVVSHAFKNALVPVITIMGLQFALLLSGAVLTERTYNWPGLGSQLIRYLDNRDYVAVQGLITFFALTVVLVSVLIDLINAWVDPRVRYR